MTVRVRPAFKAQFLVTAKRRGLSVSEAQRQALQEWVK